MPYRSAKTGRYVSKKSAKRSPNTTVNESSKKSGRSRIVHRSAKSGRFVNSAAVARWPNQTLTEFIQSLLGEKSKLLVQFFPETVYHYNTSPVDNRFASVWKLQ